MMQRVPVFVSREDLVKILEGIKQGVESGDSLEGSFSYELPEENDPPDGFRVMASYRVGNLQGQGGIRMFGGMRERH